MSLLPKGSDDVIKPKRATRSTNIDVKLAPKYTFSILKPALGGGRKSYKKGRSMGRDLKKSLEDMKYNDASSDGSDDRNDVEGVTNVNSDRNMVYDDAGRFVNQGIEDNRGFEGVNIEGSCGFNSTDSLYKDSELEDEVSSVSKSNVVKNVEKSVKLSANDENFVGDMHVPFNENVILNPGANFINDTSNEVRRNKVNGVVRNMVWLSLNEINRKDMGINVVGVKATNTDMFDSTSGTKSMSFISTFQGLSASGNNKLSRIPVRVNKEFNKVVDMDPLLSVKRMNFVLENRSWLIEGKPLFVQKSEAELCMEKPEPTRVPIWVIIMNVPLEAWNSHGISRLASSIIDATKELPDSIEICYSKLVKSMKLKIEYAWKPPLCTHCKGVSSGVEQSLNGKGGWQDVRKTNRSGASISNNVDQRYNNRYGFGYRGGYNVRGRGGRGGMNGRGGLSGGRGGVYQRENNEGVVGHRANKGENVDNAKSGSVKKTNEKTRVTIKISFDALVDESVEIGGDEWVQMRGKMDLATELGMQIDESEKKRWSKDLIKYYADKCEAKARQNLIAGLKWRIAKLKQDIVHGNTYVSKVANEEAEKQCVALMKTDGITRNKAFGKIYDETYRCELIKINDRRLEETWNDEMIEQYETLMGEKVDKMMKDGFQEGFVQSMDEEVAEDTSNSAKFMTRDEVQNVMEDNDILLQVEKGVELQWGGILMFSVPNCCLIPVRINVQSFGVQEFRDCVDSLSLEDIKLTRLFYTWIQVRMDPSKGVLKKLDRVMGNGHFVSDFSNSFANFLPFVSSDHSLAVLVMPEVKGKSNKAFRFMNYLANKDDFVDVVRQHWFVPVKGFNMYIHGKRHKALKKHMRSFNKKNGNVCEKLKRLKVELARVQEELSRIIQIVTKNRIEVIYDDEGNTIHGSNIVDAFVSHFKKFFGTCDVVFPIIDPGNLFTKKLDDEAAMDLIKPVSDCEIKAVLFDIDDNKASGPDGYSSKFFKAAWSVVGRDTCSDVKEFFKSGKLISEFNASIISLIPKVVNPKNVIDYRPISFMEVLNLMVIRQAKAEKRFEYHKDCKELKITSLCFADDLLMLCHGDLISALVLRRGLDEFYFSASLRPSMSKSEDFFGNIFDKVIDDIKFVMPFKVGVLPIKYLGVPMMSKGLTSKDCKPLIEMIKKRIGDWRNNPLSFAGVSLLGEWRVLLGKRCMWDDELSRVYSWSWKQLIDLRDKIKDFVQKWPIEWDDRFDVITKVPVPKLDTNIKDKTVWVDKNGKEKAFSVKEAWRAIRDDCPKVIWLWEMLKQMAKLEGISNCWPSIISAIVNKYPTNSIWSVIQRMRLLGLNIKSTPSVLEASKVWNLQINKADYYRKMDEALGNDFDPIEF
ncbi:probable L-cysteine desulfhydrase, chloroplastic [Tanacetum coccineum]